MIGRKRCVVNPMYSGWGFPAACLVGPYHGLCSLVEPRATTSDGGSLVFLSEERCLSLARTIERHRVRFADLPTVVLRVLARRRRQATDLSSVQLLVTGACAMSPYERRRLLKLFPALLATGDHYGTTEVSFGVNCVK